MCILIAKIRNLSEVTTISLYFYGFFEKKLQKVLEIQEKVVPLHPQSRKRQLDAKELGYGVMVTLQILVLPFLVRVRVPQPKDGCAKAHPFFLLYPTLSPRPNHRARLSNPVHLSHIPDYYHFFASQWFRIYKQRGIFVFFKIPRRTSQPNILKIKRSAHLTKKLLPKYFWNFVLNSRFAV